MTYVNTSSADDHNAALPRSLAGRMIGILFMLSGLITSSSVLLPMPPQVHPYAVLYIGLFAIALGATTWLLPWNRWPRRVMLVFVPLAFVLISLHNFFGGADPYRYSIFYMVAFIWIGIAQPRGTSFWFIPPFAVSYLAPLLLLDANAYVIGSVAYTLPVCLFISEALAWVAERLRKVQAALTQSEMRFRSLVQNASDMVMIIDADTTIRYLSPSFERILGYNTAGLLHTRLSALVHQDDLVNIQTTFDQTLRQLGASKTFECRVRHQDGAWRDIETTSTNLMHDHNIHGIVLNSRDITERKALEAQLTHQAFHDPLTGLANRAAFGDRVEQALMRNERRGKALAVLFLDLDNFKTVNDRFGHATGDRLLMTVAERLRECLRASDVAARLGGDEFAILLEDVNDAANVVQVAERVLQTLRQPFALAGEPMYIGVSIGIAWSRAGQSAADLLRNADIAMYSVKHTGKGHYAVFAPDTPASPGAQDVIELSHVVHSSM